MTRAWSLALAILMLGASRTEAQGIGPVVKYGKWLLAAGAVGMNYLALRAHNRADDAFDALEARCAGTHDHCILGPNGSYLDPVTEDLYQSSLRHDRIARGWLIGGETTLAGAAALFVWELSRPKGRPGNIPFEPEVRVLRGATGLGLRYGF